MAKKAVSKVRVKSPILELHCGLKLTHGMATSLLHGLQHSQIFPVSAAFSLQDTNTREQCSFRLSEDALSYS